MDAVRAHVYIEGRVQGVFYRDWTLRQARSLRLKGWVRNLEDGRVDVVWEKATKVYRNFEVVR